MKNIYGIFVQLKHRKSLGSGTESIIFILFYSEVLNMHSEACFQISYKEKSFGNNFLCGTENLFIIFFCCSKMYTKKFKEYLKRFFMKFYVQKNVPYKRGDRFSFRKQKVNSFFR